MVEKTKTWLIILLAIITGYSVYQHYIDCDKSSHAEQTAQKLSKAVLQTGKMVADLSDTIKKNSSIFNKDKGVFVKDSSDIRPLNFDTTKTALNIALVDNKEATKSFIDSLSFYKNRCSYLCNEIEKLKSINKNYTFSISNKKPDSNQINAGVYIYPFQRSTHESIFSPQKNYLRIVNTMAGGTINGAPFYDYEEINTEANQLLFQARSSYNFNNKSVQFGGGLELKINRFSFNGAEFYNLRNKSFTTSIGTRVDMYRIKF